MSLDAQRDCSLARHASDILRVEIFALDLYVNFRTRTTTGNTEWSPDRRRSGRGSRLVWAATAGCSNVREAISDLAVRG